MFAVWGSCVLNISVSVCGYVVFYVEPGNDNGQVLAGRATRPAGPRTYFKGMFYMLKWMLWHYNINWRRVLFTGVDLHKHLKDLL